MISFTLLAVPDSKTFGCVQLADAVALAAYVSLKDQRLCAEYRQPVLSTVRHNNLPAVIRDSFGGAELAVTLTG